MKNILSRIPVLAALALAVAGCATSGGPRGSVQFGRKVVLEAVSAQPSMVSLPRTQYPRALLQSGIEGTAVVSFVVDERGYSREVKLIEASHEEFGQAAIAMAKSLVHTPARREGRPVRCTVELTFIFLLE